MAKSNWIASAIKHPGAFKAAAHRAGKSTSSYAKSKQHAKGKIGRMARLALTLAKLRRRK